MTKKSCVYLTIYRGNRLPMFYIGSTYVDKIMNENYIGSASSKMYGDIWRYERSHHPELFEVKIVKTFDSREDALLYERFLHVTLDAPNNELYANRSFAMWAMFHRSCTGGVKSRRARTTGIKRTGNALENIRAGCKRRRKATAEELLIRKMKNSLTRKKNGTRSGMLGKRHKEETIIKMSGRIPYNKGKTWEEMHPGKPNPNIGTTHSEETRKKISESNKGKPKNFSEETKRRRLAAISGKNSNTAIVVDIYNELGVLMYTAHGNFSQTCIENGLPLRSLVVSYRNGGTPIKTVWHKNKEVPHRGWYAIKRPDQTP